MACKYNFLFATFVVAFYCAPSSASQKLPSSCAEAFRIAGSGAQSGIYQLQLPDVELKPFFVYCLRDPAGGSAWTLVQRRQDENIDFYRGWQEYKMGFGNLHANFFIGLDKLHALTQTQLNELWIELEDFENVTRHAKYETFAIGSEAQKYALVVLGAYTGDAGDSLTTTHAGQMFTTYDQDNDEQVKDNCAVKYRGAWWYKDCHQSNLNGLYLRGSNENFAQGVVWYTWRGFNYSMKYVHMAIRPKN